MDIGEMQSILIGSATRFGAVGRKRVPYLVAVLLALPLCRSFAQPSTLFVINNRLQLERHAGALYRPVFGSIDSVATGAMLDSLVQRGFDPESDLFGYDSTIIGFAGGEMLARREGRTHVIVRYPVYPGYLDTVDLLVRRDREGLAVSLEHRPIALVVDSVALRHRRRIPWADNRVYQDYEFQIYSDFKGDERTFYYQARISQERYRRLGREAFKAMFSSEMRRLLWGDESWGWGVMELPDTDDAKLYPITGYDSTIIAIKGREVVPLRAGSTTLRVQFPEMVKSVTIDVDPALVVRVRKDGER